MSDRFERALSVASHARDGPLGAPEMVAVVAAWQAEVADILADYLDPTTEMGAAEAEWRIADSFHRLITVIESGGV